MKLVVQVLQGSRTIVEFEVELLSHTDLADLRRIWEMEQFLNSSTDHRWHINVIASESDEAVS